MKHRLVSFVLLFTVSISFGGLGRFLHELDAVRSAGVAASQHWRDGDAPTHHPGHDHEHCAVCQLLAAPGIDRLPGNVACAIVVPPTRSLPRDESTPHVVSRPISLDARGPPQRPHV